MSVTKLFHRDNILRTAVLIWLTIAYVALWGDLSIANVVAGLIVAIVVTVALPLPRIPVGGRLHPISLVKLIVVSVYYALESSLQVAWLALRPGPPPVSGVLRVHLSIQSDLVLVLCTDLLNLIPGTMVLELDRSKCVAFVHVLDIGSDQAVAKFYTVTRRVEGLLIDAFERPADRHHPDTSEVNP